MNLPSTRPTPDQIDAGTIHHFVTVTPSPKKLDIVILENPKRYRLITSDNAVCVTGTYDECLRLKRKMLVAAGFTLPTP